MRQEGKTIRVQQDVRLEEKKRHPSRSLHQPNKLVHGSGLQQQAAANRSSETKIKKNTYTTRHMRPFCLYSTARASCTPRAPVTCAPDRRCASALLCAPKTAHLFVDDLQRWESLGRGWDSVEIRVALLRGADVWGAGQGRGCDGGIDRAEVVWCDGECVGKVAGAALVVGRCWLVLVVVVLLLLLLLLALHWLGLRLWRRGRGACCVKGRSRCLFAANGWLAVAVWLAGFGATIMPHEK